MKVSVIVPVYNGEAYLEACIDSLLAQNMKAGEYEILCVDDGSRDASGALLDTYALRYPDRVRVIHKENGGVWKARETGLLAAQGEYVGFCDCDDTVSPRMLSSMYEKAQRTHADIVVCAFERIRVSEDGEETVGKPEMTCFQDAVCALPKRRNILPVVNTALWNKLIRRELALKHIRFEETPRVAEDMMFLLSLYPQAERIAFLKEPLYQYYVRSSSSFSEVKAHELAAHEAQMERTAAFVRAQAGDSYDEIVSQFAMIHFGLSLLLKIRETGSDGRRIRKDVIKWLDRAFPGWKTNSYLKLSYICSGHPYLGKTMIVRMMFRFGLMEPFIGLYRFVTEKLGMEIKW